MYVYIYIIYIYSFFQIHDSWHTAKKTDTSRFKIPHPHFSQRVFFNQPNSGGQPWKFKHAETSGALERCHLSCAWRDECQLSTWLRTSTLHPVGWSPPRCFGTYYYLPGLKEHGNHHHHHAFESKGWLCSERIKVKTSSFFNFEAQKWHEILLRKFPTL